MKKLSLLIVLFFSLCFWLVAQQKDNAFYKMIQALLEHNVNEISVEKAKGLSNAIFIDAREKKEYDVSHIKDAIWVGYDDFDIKRIQHVDKKSTIIVYCSVGYRSEKITHKLQENGFKNCSNLIGGIFDWSNKGYPLYDNSGKLTTKVHAFDKTWGVWLNTSEKVY